MRSHISTKFTLLACTVRGEEGLMGRIDIIEGTLAKGFGSLGG
jgi:hypothetical protein